MKELKPGVKEMDNLINEEVLVLNVLSMGRW
jgi:hypothetical protein